MLSRNEFVFCRLENCDAISKFNLLPYIELRLFREQTNLFSIYTEWMPKNIERNNNIVAFKQKVEINQRKCRKSFVETEDI